MTRQLRPWIWLGIALAIAAALWFVPLFDVLGFEQALVVAGLASVAGLDLGAAHARSLQDPARPVLERADQPTRALGRGLAGSIARTLMIVFVPLAAGAVHGLWAPTCDWTFGLEAYALMPIASGVLAAATGHLITVVVGRRDHASWLPHRSTWLAVVLPIVVLAGAGLVRFYNEPPVFTYDALIGYFPGNMYDENIVLGAPLIWSRIEQLAWVLALACAIASRLDVPSYRARLYAPRPQRAFGLAAAAVAFVCIAGLVRSDAGSFGYAVDASDLQRELGGRYETPHFIIYYARTPEIERDIGLIAADHEFRYAQVVSQIGEAPAGKLTSYYFADTAQKARWFGARNVEMAKPWRHEIYLDHRSFPHTSLRHEIAHAVAASFGDPIFGVARRDVVLFNPGIIEGLAVALDWPGGDGPLTPHEAVRALELEGLVPSLRQVLSIQFFEFSSARGYTTAGSFLRYLLDTYGAPKLRALYHNGGDFEAAYGKSLADLEVDWRVMIDKIELPKSVVEGMREHFRGGSVFSRPCPHAIAARREAAFAELGHDRERALVLIREACADSPGEPRNRIDLAGALAVGNPLERAEATATLTEIAGDEGVTTTLRAEAFEKLARLASTDRDRLALIEKARALPLEEHRQYDAEAFALQHDGPAGDALRSYFFSTTGPEPIADAQHAADVEPALGFGHYLLGLQLYNGGDYADAASELDTALARGLPGTNFERFAARRLAIAAYRASDKARLDRAIVALEVGADRSQVDRLLAADWRQREKFAATGSL
ncbi:MAG TPA: hypothetical protein VGL61_31695 [Kofleriaceae bacterium]